MDDSGGFDANFVDPPPNELICPVCTCVVKNPIQISKCGHRLCSVCYTSLRKFSKECLCPTDRTVIEDNQVFADIGAGRRVMSLQVKCEYFKKGCVWVGELRELQSHVDQCCYESLEEEYYIENQDNEVVDQTDLQDKLTKLETYLQLKDTEINGLNRQLQNLRKQLQSSLKTVSAVEEKQKSISHELNELRSLKTQLLKTSKALDKQKSEEAQFGTLRKEVSSNTKKLQSLSARYENNNKKLDEMEGIVEMADKVPGIQNSIQILQAKVDDYCEEIKTLKSKQKSDEIESDNLKKDVKKAHNIIQNLTDRFEKKVKKIDNNCNLINNLDKKIKNKKLNELQGGNMEVNNKTPDIENSIHPLIQASIDEAKVSSLHPSIQAAKVDNVNKEMKKTKDTQTTNEIETLEKLRNEVIETKNELQNIKDRFERKEEIIDNMHKSVSISPMEQFCQSIQVLEKKIDDYHNEIEHIKSSQIAENEGNTKGLEENTKAKKGIRYFLSNLMEKKSSEANLKINKE